MKKYELFTITRFAELSGHKMALGLAQIIYPWDHVFLLVCSVHLHLGVIHTLATVYPLIF